MKFQTLFNIAKNRKLFPKTLSSYNTLNHVQIQNVFFANLSLPKSELQIKLFFAINSNNWIATLPKILFRNEVFLIGRNMEVQWKL